MNTGTTLTLATMMFFAGIGIPAMASMNAGLGKGLSAPMLAVSVLSLVALVTSLAATVIFERPELAAATEVPLPYYFAGLLFVVYIGTITVAAPQIGLGNAVFLVLIGQLISAAVIDHFGLLGSDPSPATPTRLGGIALMALGVFLARQPHSVPPINP